MDNIVKEIKAFRDAGEPAQFLLEHCVRKLHGSLEKWNWVGIYLLVGDTLVLGPFAGEPTEHTRIPVGNGVCGSAVAMDCNMIVDDVTACDNYIACTIDTKSEIVVLIRHKGKVVGQFDVDSNSPAAFTENDERLLQELAEVVSEQCDDLIQIAAGSLHQR